MTYASEKGMIVGKSYLYQSNGAGWDALDGKFVEFRNDDGTQLPSFYVPTSVSPDGWAYASLEHFSMRAAEATVVTPAPAFSVDVNNGTTSFFVAKELTAAQIAAVFAAAGLA